VKKPPGSYFHCIKCDLIFRDPRERLSIEEEKARYDMHHNDDTSAYRQFLQPIVQEIENLAQSTAKSPAELQILDYGCGPTAMLAKFLAEKSYVTENYDIFYHTDQRPLQRTYDVITSTEVWEHFYHPLEEIEQLTKLLKPAGILAIMTSAHQDEAHFADWYYRRDPTHVVFFSETTMKWLAEHFKLRLIKSQSPYWIFQKQESP
jgi:2-polyprenyl-3-methyl-5-hydroxy-6-metoxy-1,4-benzoquinol methylase